MNYNKIGSKWLGINIPQILFGRDKSKKKGISFRNMLQLHGELSPRNRRQGWDKLFIETGWRGQASKGDQYPLQALTAILFQES